MTEIIEDDKWASYFKSSKILEISSIDKDDDKFSEYDIKIISKSINNLTSKLNSLSLGKNPSK